MAARFPRFGTRPSDFQIWPNFLMQAPSRGPGLLGSPASSGPVAIDPILCENGNLLLAENGNYLQKE